MMLRMLLAVAWIAGSIASPTPGRAEEPETPGSDQTPELAEGPVTESAPRVGRLVSRSMAVS